MTSWRDSASTLAQADLDGLLEPAIGFAQRELSLRGEFYPFAIALNRRGTTEIVSPRPEEMGNRPESIDVMAACRRTLSSQRDSLRAVAIVSDVRLVDGTGDAVHLELEHTEGPSLTVSLPYSKKRWSKHIDFGEMKVSSGYRRIWGTVPG